MIWVGVANARQYRSEHLGYVDGDRLHMRRSLARLIFRLLDPCGSSEDSNCFLGNPAP
jgi:hypothetical protein